MSKITFELNGKQVEAEEGSILLDVARRNGIDIPTLCNDPRLKPTAACRLCLVEVQGARGPMPACITGVAAGMVVRTSTEDIIKHRRMALELLLSDHYGDCLAPCKLACPAGIDIQGYIGHIANGHYREAMKLIVENNPFPSVCGRVCPRFCELKCRRNLLEAPVAINALKRFVADYSMRSSDPYVPEAKQATGHRVAVVGGGPAGLSAAYYLALEGHQVTVFESGPQLGGMLRYGIPEYRLPKAILDREIAAITRLCHEVRCNTRLGQDFTVDSLKNDGYAAVFLAIGAQVSQKMRLEGEETPGVISGISFLRDVALGQRVNLGEKVAIIGGGNTAIDAARTALRLGAREVTVVYRRSRDEMPANHEEVEQAEQEGVQFHFLANPVKIHARNGRVATMECIKMALGEPDSSGRRRPVPIAGSETHMDVDTVIAAIGQTMDSSSVEQEQLKLDRQGFISVREGTLETSVAGVFSGGDCVSGPATVVEAIAAGRRAAICIGQYLAGQPVAPPKQPFNCSKGSLEEINAQDYADVERIPRAAMPLLEVRARRGNFTEIELGFDESTAKNEARRCLACGCQDIFTCKLRELADEYNADSSRYDGHKHRRHLRENEHHHILRDPNKCVLCGCCVRICSEVQGIDALGYARRGFETVVEPALGMPLDETDCDSCGQCISACPTGALTPKVNLPKPGPWRLKKVPTICPHCGIGCSIELNLSCDKVVMVSSPIGSPVNNGNLCKKGRFCPTTLHNMKRLRTPLVKRGGKLVETTWEDAIALAAKGLTQLRNRGGDTLAILSSPQLTNEENYLVQKLARAALKTNNIASLSGSDMDDTMKNIFGVNASTCSYADILASDLIFVYRSDLVEDYPIIGLKVREAVAKGCKLVTLSSHQTRIDSLAKISLKINRRTGLDLLDAMLRYIFSYKLIDHAFVNARTTGIEELTKHISDRPFDSIAGVPWVSPARMVEATHLYVRAQRPVIIVDADKVTPTELSLLGNLALITGNAGRQGAGILVLRTPGNAQGLIDMGVCPDYLPGQHPLADTTARQRFERGWSTSLPQHKGRDYTGIVQGIERAEIQGVLVAGGEAAGESGTAIFEVPIFSVAISTVAPGKPPYPDVVLPGANFAESEGTYTNCERRIQRLNQAISPPAGKQNWEIISALADALGYPMDYSGVASINEEIARLALMYRAAGIQGPAAADGERMHFSLPRRNGTDQVKRVWTEATY